MSTSLNPADDIAATDTRGARKHMAWFALVFFLLALTPYLNPSLVRLRPWVPGEGMPIVRMFQRSQALPSFAEASRDSHAAAAGLDTGLSKAVIASARESDDVAEVPPSAPDNNEQQTRGATVAIDPKEYEGVEQAIEHPEHLARFFAKLKLVANKKNKTIARVAHYGDSSIAADAITRTLRRRMQRRFGDAGHGFILIARGGMHYIHADVRQSSSDGWEVLSAVRDGLGTGFYGYGGVQARGRGGERATFSTIEDAPIGTRVSRYELFYQRFKHGGRVRLQLDNDRDGAQIIDTAADERSDGFATVTAPDGPHQLSIKVLGGREVHLYGVAMERAGPGVVYDSLGLVGARAQRLLNIEGEHIAGQIAHRKPDLLVLAFGGNEAGNKWLDVSRYEEELHTVVRAMRAGRKEMDCLLFAPLDQAERNERGKVVTIEKLPPIVEAQRRVAAAEKCAFFDAFSAMGGEGSMERWYRSRPQLAGSDLRHATPEGYRVMGTLYYKALLKAFAESQ